MLKMLKRKVNTTYKRPGSLATHFVIKNRALDILEGTLALNKHKPDEIHRPCIPLT